MGSRQSIKTVLGEFQGPVMVGGRAPGGREAMEVRVSDEAGMDGAK